MMYKSGRNVSLVCSCNSSSIGRVLACQARGLWVRDPSIAQGGNSGSNPLLIPKGVRYSSGYEAPHGFSSY